MGAVLAGEAWSVPSLQKTLDQWAKARLVALRGGRDNPVIKLKAHLRALTKQKGSSKTEADETADTLIIQCARLESSFLLAGKALELSPANAVEIINGLRSSARDLQSHFARCSDIVREIAEHRQASSKDRAAERAAAERDRRNLLRPYTMKGTPLPLSSYLLHLGLAGKDREFEASSESVSVHAVQTWSQPFVSEEHQQKSSGAASSAIA